MFQANSGLLTTRNRKQKMREETAPARGFRKRLVHGLAGRPILFDSLRFLLEGGFRGEKEVLRREGILEGVSILDLGCGTGALAGFFQSTHYVGVDLNGDYIRQAKKKHPDHLFLQMDGRHLTWKKPSFDVVIIGGVLHHLNDQDAASLLGEARRVLKPEGGRLVLWEDIPIHSRFNLIGRAVQWLDKGEHIRLERQYLELIRTSFRKTYFYPMATGVCNYLVVVARA